MNERSAVLVDDEVAGGRREPTALQRILYTPAVSDWIFAGYLFTVVVGLTLAPSSTNRNEYLTVIASVLTTFLVCVYGYRYMEQRSGVARTYLPSTAYKLLPLPCMLGLYLNLRPILPIINAASYDERLYRLDQHIFGVEPTLWVERFSTPGVVEWFSFFYYSYFFFISAFIFVITLTSRSDQRQAHFATGFLGVLCIGHFLYTLVPGLGPYHHLAHEYQAPVQGGVFFDLVLNAVSAGGPLRDIFPSLHTAMPTFCTLFAWKHYRRFAPIATFFCVNIIIATIILRWHYGVDVLAGIILAVTAFVSAPRIVELYQARRKAIGLGDLRRW
jgi:membrane-associated phospholipid phosphatase